jgi:serine/threonine protein kinase/dipeptidyl aminopeptidase/acylaminoacyl peptidase
MPLNPGTRVGSYQITATVGAGGMGEVYRAHDSRLKRDVAIKVLPPDFAADPARLGRFEREAQVLAALNHPNIAAIYGLENAAGSPALVMELVEGGSLAELIARGPIPVADALPIARSIAEALEYAHERGIVHRDLKPANVVVTSGGTVKVLDFGLAKAITGDDSSSSTSDATHSPTLTSPATRAGVILGTAAYMSPEQARGKDVDRRADIWAFGVVLYEMLTGTRMFDGETISDTIAAILTRAPDFSRLPAGTPAGVRRLLERCLDRDPKQRLRDIGEARIVLERAIRGEDDAPPAAPTPPRRAGSRVPWAIAGLAVAAAVTSVFLMRGRPEPVTHPLKFEQKTFRDQTITQALFAPDGQTIYFSSAETGNTPHLFSMRPEFIEPVRVSDEPLQLLSISSKGELAVLTGPRWLGHRMCIGTLARMPLGGGAPREIMEGVRQAVWAPDGGQLAIIREVGGLDRLEFPPGNVLFQTSGYVSDMRFSPHGDRIAYFEHPARWDDRGLIAVVDLEGRRTVLSEGYWGEEGIAWSRTGDTVYFSAGTGYADFSVYAVDLDGEVRVALQSAGGILIHDIAANGDWIVTRDDLARTIRARAPGETRERDLSWQDFCNVVDLSLDGRTMLFGAAGTSAGQNYRVCLRGTDGSSVVVIGEGDPQGLSPDGNWAAAIIYPNRLMLYPTGAGEARELEPGPIALLQDVQWFPDGKRLLVVGAEQGAANKCWLQEMAGGPPVPANHLGEGIPAAFLSPDGERALICDSDGVWSLAAIDGGSEPVAVPAIGATELVDSWSQDGRSVLVHEMNVPAQVDRVDLVSGTRSHYLTISPPETGVQAVISVCFSGDQTAYAYDSLRYLSYLYYVRGAR